MHYEQHGTSLWYGTADAAAPGPEVSVAPGGQATGLSVTVGVRPIGSRNSIAIHYRVNGGASTSLHASLARTDVHANAQYFVVALPAFRVGDMVSYIPVLGSPGLQMPSGPNAAKFQSSFRIVNTGSSATKGTGSGVSSAVAKTSASQSGEVPTPATPAPNSTTSSDAAIHQSGGRQIPSNQEAEGHVATSTPGAVAGPHAANGSHTATGPHAATSPHVAAGHPGSHATTGHPAGVHHGPEAEDLKEALRAVLRASSVLNSGALEDSFIKLYFGHDR